MQWSTDWPAGAFYCTLLSQHCYRLPVPFNDRPFGSAKLLPEMIQTCQQAATQPGGGGGGGGERALPYLAKTGVCRSTGYDFQGLASYKQGIQFHYLAS